MHTLYTIYVFSEYSDDGEPAGEFVSADPAEVQAKIAAAKSRHGADLLRVESVELSDDNYLTRMLTHAGRKRHWKAPHSPVHCYMEQHLLELANFGVALEVGPTTRLMCERRWVQGGPAGVERYWDTLRTAVVRLGDAERNVYLLD